MNVEPGEVHYQESVDPISKTELRLMNSRGRELLLRHCDFPLFESLLREHHITLTGTSVLDAGCGAGYSLTLIDERFRPRELTGIDIVPSQVEKARSRGTSATVRVGDITALDIPSQSFDAVFLLEVLHHSQEWRTGLSEVARVLKDGGALILEEPGTLQLQLERLVLGRSSSLETSLRTGFSLEHLSGEMPANGLRVVDSRRLYLGLSRVFLCVKSASVKMQRGT